MKVEYMIFDIWGNAVDYSTDEALIKQHLLGFTVEVDDCFIMQYIDDNPTVVITRDDILNENRS